MAQARRFHAPGQGGRTGLRIGQEVDSLSGYFEAGRKAIRSAAREYDDSTGSESESDDEREEDDDGDTAGPDSSYLQSSSAVQPRKGSAMGRKSGVGSSSMDIENSYAPSPTRTSTAYANGAPSPGASFDNYAGNDDSVIDYGANEDDNFDRGVGPSARPSLAPSTPGAGRRQISDISRSRIDTPQRSSRMSMLDVTRPSDESIPMDLAGDDDYPEMSMGPSPNKQGGSSRYLDNDDDEDGIAEGAYDQDVPEGAFDEQAADQEERGATAEKAPRKRGRPRKNASPSDRPTSANPGRGLPSHLGGTRIVERIASSKGKAGTIMDGNVRRSTRHRIAPLDWWRGERAVYGRSRRRQRDAAQENGDGEEQDPDETIPADSFEDAPIKGYAVPTLKSVIRVERAPGEGTFSGMRMPTKGKGSGLRGHAKGKARKKSRSEIEDGEEIEIELDPEADTRHPEDGWDDNTDTHGVVWDVEQQTEVHRKIACPVTRVRTKNAAHSSFAFEKIFGVDEYMAAGMLVLPPGGKKPLKPTKDNNYVFLVVQGAVDVQIYRTLFRLGPCGMFAIPKGNTYEIRNVCRRTARIFFAQARQPHSSVKRADGSNAIGVSVDTSVNGQTVSADVADAGRVEGDATGDDTTTTVAAPRPAKQKKPANGTVNGNGTAVNGDSLDRSTSQSPTPPSPAIPVAGVKRPRGRPKKVVDPPAATTRTSQSPEPPSAPAKKPRGRPKKNAT